MLHAGVWVLHAGLWVLTFPCVLPMVRAALFRHPYLLVALLGWQSKEHYQCSAATAGKYLQELSKRNP